MANTPRTGVVVPGEASRRGLRDTGRTTDEALSAAVDHQRFERLFEAHGPAVHELLRRLCRNGPEADDLFQETAVRIWRTLPETDELDNPRGWMTTIAYRLFLDGRRRRQRRPETSLEIDTTGDAENPAADIERREEADRARAAIASLDDPIREVFLLHYTAGLSLRETGETMGLSEGTVKSRLNRGLKTLRKVLG